MDASTRYPMDEDLLPEIGRVAWIATRLQFSIRDAINCLEGEASDNSFDLTLGVANGCLEKLAKDNSRTDIVDWCATARLAIERRNGLVHAIAHTTVGGRQALRGSTSVRPPEYDKSEIRAIANALAEASLSIPR